MDSATAALAGAGIGALAALAGQYLAHRFAIERADKDRLRDLVDDGTAAMRDALTLADSAIASADPRVRRPAAIELYGAVRGVAMAESKIGTHLVDNHSLAVGYRTAAERLAELTRQVLSSAAGEDVTTDELSRLWYLARQDFDRFRDMAQELVALRERRRGLPFRRESPGQSPAA